ncbi:hypothetical protein AX15_003838 [Amanita polypyramis BW_CC]|nr:hypothetical protein AX15_003838 [Amanita polypyramis BW_CC]
MEQALAHGVAQLLQKTDLKHRLLIGIAGIPASGKSTFAALVAGHINRILRSNAGVEGAIDGKAAPEAVLVSLDGWHLTRAQLDAMPDPKLAYDRRGAHWTFDGERYVAFVRSLKEEILSTNEQLITAPSFDHALKDPAPGAISIHPHHRIIIIEGLYTFLSIDPWREAGVLLDERWLIQIDVEEAQRRLVKRHVLTGVAKDLEEAIWRAKESDMPNGRFLLTNSLEPTRVIVSKDDLLLRPPDTRRAN